MADTAGGLAVGAATVVAAAALGGTAVAAAGERDVSLAAAAAADAAAHRLTAVAPGLRLRPAWVNAQCPRLEAAASASSGSSACSVSSPEDTLLRLFAAADLRDSCEGSLPPDLDRQHNIRLEHAHIVQVLQAVDIAHPIAAGGEEGGTDDASHNGGGTSGSGAGEGPGATPQVHRGQKMLKVCFTDGVQVVCGIELRPVAALRGVRPGTKVILGNRPLLRRGLLLLEPKNLEVLGPLQTSTSATSSQQIAAVPSSHEPAAATVSVLSAGATGEALTGSARAPEPRFAIEGEEIRVPAANSDALACDASLRSGASPRPATNTSAPQLAHGAMLGSCISSTSSAQLRSQEASIAAQAAEAFDPPRDVVPHIAAARPTASTTSVVTPWTATHTVSPREPIPLASSAVVANATHMAVNMRDEDVRPVANPPRADPSSAPAVAALGGTGAGVVAMALEREVTQRFYVCDAGLVDTGLWVRLCDGLDKCEALMQLPLALRLFGDAPPPTWSSKAKMLHGLFQLRWDAEVGGGRGGLTVISFRRSPMPQEVEELLGVLSGGSKGITAIATVA